jgi:hypothetical protein
MPGDVTTTTAGSRADASVGSGGSSGASAGAVAIDPPSAGSGGASDEPGVPGDACQGGQVDLGRHSAHCGECGQACSPRMLAAGPRWPVAITADATHVYWTTSGNEGAVLSAPLAGGDTTTLAAMQTWPSAIAVDATSVYWASDGTIKKVSRNGGTPIRLVTDPIDAKALVVDGEHVYFASVGAEELASIMRVPLAGGTPELLASEPGSGPTAIALDATHVYWANGSSNEDHAVLKVARDGGTPAVLVTAAYSVFGMAADTTGVYFTTFDTLAGGVTSSTVRRVALNGGDAVTLATGEAQPLGLAIDDASVYWVNASTSYTFSAGAGTDGTTLSVAKTGGPVTTLAGSEADPGSIVSNGARVCWTRYSDGTVACLGGCANSRCE